MVDMFNYLFEGPRYLTDNQKISKALNKVDSWIKSPIGIEGIFKDDPEKKLCIGRIGDPKSPIYSFSLEDTRLKRHVTTSSESLTIQYRKQIEKIFEQTN